MGRVLTGYVKVAPPGHEPVRNRDVLRQAAVQRFLRDDGSVPVPAVLCSDEGSPPEVPPFFVTEEVTGDCLEPLVDADEPPSATVLTARATDAAITLARLHQVDVRPLAEVDAGDGVDLVSEVRRWSRIFGTVDDASLAEQGAACGRHLERTAPASLAPALVHGDFRLGNLMCDDTGVRAVLDWEIWSLSDPRIDVAWFLMTLSADGLPSAVRSSAAGLLSPDQALAVYETAAARQLTDLEWFSALSRFRAAAAMALNVKHNRRRPQPDPRIESYAARLPQFLDVAAGLITTVS